LIDKCPAIAVAAFFVRHPSPRSDVIMAAPRGRFPLEVKMEYWNTKLFLILNAASTADPWIVHFAFLLAQDLVYVGPVPVACLWIWGSLRRRGELVAVGGGLLLALAISTVISAFSYHPRPFMIGVGNALMPHNAETSFPSDHATFLWTLGLGLIATGAPRRWGALIVVLGALTAWARVYLGVHWPLDMLGSFVIACVCAAFAVTIRPIATARLAPSIERLYHWTIDTLRLLPAVFPRRGSSAE
jgi:undecaprenyl-diphosphatase